MDFKIFKYLVTMSGKFSSNEVITFSSTLVWELLLYDLLFLRFFSLLKITEWRISSSSSLPSKASGELSTFSRNPAFSKQFLIMLLYMLFQLLWKYWVAYKIDGHKVCFLSSAFIQSSNKSSTKTWVQHWVLPHLKAGRWCVSLKHTFLTVILSSEFQTKSSRSMFQAGFESM